MEGKNVSFLFSVCALWFDTDQDYELLYKGCSFFCIDDFFFGWIKVLLLDF